MDAVHSGPSVSSDVLDKLKAQIEANDHKNLIVPTLGDRSFRSGEEVKKRKPPTQSTTDTEPPSKRSKYEKKSKEKSEEDPKGEIPEVTLETLEDEDFSHDQKSLIKEMVTSDSDAQSFSTVVGEGVSNNAETQLDYADLQID